MCEYVSFGGGGNFLYVCNFYIKQSQSSRISLFLSDKLTTKLAAVCDILIFTLQTREWY